MCFTCTTEQRSEKIEPSQKQNCGFMSPCTFASRAASIMGAFVHLTLRKREESAVRTCSASAAKQRYKEGARRKNARFVAAFARSGALLRSQ